MTKVTILFKLVEAENSKEFKEVAGNHEKKLKDILDRKIKEGSAYEVETVKLIEALAMTATDVTQMISLLTGDTFDKGKYFEERKAELTKLFVDAIADGSPIEEEVRQMIEALGYEFARTTVLVKISEEFKKETMKKVLKELDASL